MRIKQLGLFMATSCILYSCGTKNKKVGYEGEELHKMTEILRDKQTKEATLIVETQGEWEIYAGKSVETIDMTKPLATGTGAGKMPLNVPADTRSYFQLVTKEGSAIIADRHLPMTGGFNFRDMGGIKTANGKYVKWGKVFRSDELKDLTESDLEYLSSIPLISVVDFRAKGEIESAPDVNPKSLKENYAYCINPGSLLDLDKVATLPENEVAQFMFTMNESFSTSEAIIEQYRKYFELLQDETKIPLMFHCTAGKDRTGMGGALFLFSLGVDEKTIMEDYLLSNKYIGPKYKSTIEKHPSLKPLLEVRSEYLLAGINMIKKNYGTVDKFLVEKLNVDLGKMQQMYLYQ